MRKYERKKASSIVRLFAPPCAYLAIDAFFVEVATLPIDDKVDNMFQKNKCMYLQ